MSTRTRSSTARGTATTTISNRSTPTNHKNKNQTKDTFCVCRGPDDGTPMVNCAYCKEWYHFRCVDLEEEDAHDIDVYVCPPCTQRTGRKSVMTWEGPDGYESPTTAQTKQKITIKAQNKPRRRVKKADDDEPTEELHSEPSESSDDEYVDVRKSKRSRKNLSYESDSDTDNAPSTSQLKRKASTSDKKAVKRRKSVSVEGGLDPARKYCLGKLDELFAQIFTRYPPEEGSKEDVLKAKASQFATELEECVFNTYAEPDKHHALSVGPKYKARFNTLQFNLSKDDRISLHKNIASGAISAENLAVMSSTDLANEQMRQSIQIAEKEALEYSILKKTKVPTAKITHKGYENIEDQGGLVTERNAEFEREQAEEERRERERLMRIKSAEEHQRQKDASALMPPESPVVSQQPWGAPPNPTGDVLGSPVLMRPPPNPLFVHTTSEQARDLELNLDDIINIDKDTPERESHSASGTLPPPASVTPELSTPTRTSEVTSFATASPISPGTSFNLTSLWNAPRPSPPPEQATTPPSLPNSMDMVLPDTQIDATDNDFDMFLEDKVEDAMPAASTTPPIDRFNSSPQVWSGVISMPLDSSIPQDTQVIARQAGGRPLAPNSSYWRVLFPSGTLRIDGRVPVENSFKFLLQMRMNSSKEMISVVFSPATDSADGGFKMMSDFLINKNRHGLVFPWGNRPKEHHPGRELYIIPLLSSEPLPETIELLDDLKLPKERSENYFVGIWILGRGKLDSAVAAAVAPPPPVPMPPIYPQLPITPLLPLPPPPQPLPGLRPVEPATLAAEVASLTPEQIQAMLQMLTATNAVSPPQHQHTPPPPPPQWQPPPPQPSQLLPPQYGQPHLPYGAYPPPPNDPQPYPEFGHSPRWGQQGYGRGGDRGGDRGDRGRGRGGGKGRRGEGWRGGGGHRAPDSGWQRR